MLSEWTTVILSAPSFALLYYLLFGKSKAINSLQTFINKHMYIYICIYHSILILLLFADSGTIIFNDERNAPSMSSVLQTQELYRGMNGLQDSYDLVIVGSGLSGAVIAEQASKRSGLTSLIIDKRDHIGGNCYDYIDEHGIRVSRKYT